MAYYLAVDIGASSGRHILGSIEDGKICLEEIYRFENGMQERGGHLCWDVEYLFTEIKNGMKKCRETGKLPESIGIDTWGVDFVLLDKEGNLLGEPVGYRDRRTEGIRQKLEPVICQEELYRRTGIQFQPYNTLNQLAALQEEEPLLLQQAQMLLMMPDYLNYRLTGEARQEYTIASTSQLLEAAGGTWDTELLKILGFPQKLFLPVEKPGTLVGEVSPEVAQEIGYSCKVLLTASHDTASAVMAVPSLEEKALYISSGTWSLMGCESIDFHNDPESMAAGFTNEGGYGKRYRYLKNIMGLWMIQSVRRELAPDKSFAEICEEASREKIAAIVDCNDESFLAPESMTAAIQAYCRNTRQQVPVTLPELACVIYNSLAKCYAETKQQMERLTGLAFDRIHIIGGGSKAEYLNRLTAQYADCLVLAGPTEATAIGNLLAQMLEAGVYENLLQARQSVIESFPLDCFEPQASIRKN